MTSPSIPARAATAPMLSLSVALLLAACGGGGSSEEMPPALQGQTPTASVSASPSPSSLALTVPGIGAAASASQAEMQASAGGPSAQVQSASATKLPLTREALLAFNTDFALPHEAIPAGVPSGYDWYRGTKAASWNTPPAGFSAITGWGQAFWVKGNTTPGAYLLLKSHLTLVCHGSQRQWSLLQSSGVAGSVFQPDYATNVATSAHHPGAIEPGALAVGFPATTAYHFWPTAARGTLPGTQLCGTLTLVQARAQPFSEGSYATPNLLLGMGADYWLNRTAGWDHYKTNRDVAIGRLKLVQTGWAWYGLSTASDADLERLHENGYTNSR